MSNNILPSFPGLSWGIKKTPMWATKESNAVSGRQYTLRRRLYPIWKYRLPYEVLRDAASLTEFQQVLAFFNARNGKYDDWLYLDQFDNTATLQNMGTGDGTTDQFEILSSYGGFAEPVGAVNAGTAQVYVNEVLQTITTQYVFDAELRLISFVTPPPNGHAITWTGTYYKRCRFINDELPTDAMMKGKWKTDLEFRTFRP